MDLLWAASWKIPTSTCCHHRHSFYILCSHYMSCSPYMKNEDNVGPAWLTPTICAALHVYRRTSGTEHSGHAKYTSKIEVKVTKQHHASKKNNFNFVMKKPSVHSKVLVNQAEVNNHTIHECRLQIYCAATTGRPIRWCYIAMDMAKRVIQDALLHCVCEMGPRR